MIAIISRISMAKATFNINEQLWFGSIQDFVCNVRSDRPLASMGEIT